MKQESFSRYSSYVLLLVTVAIWALLAWEHYHGGVPSHHLLAKKEMPAISNWWGGLLLPLLTWFLLGRIRKRAFGKGNSDQEASRLILHEVYGMVGALLFGGMISVLFTYSVTDVAGTMMLAVVVLSFFLPIYRPGCLLGFVLGMTLTFGSVLPMLIGSLLGLIGLVLYAYLRPAIGYVISKLAFNFR